LQWATPDSVDPSTAGKTLQIGTGVLAGDNINFDGAIDDVRIYNRALSATEVKQLYNLSQNTVGHSNAGPGTLSNGLVGYWTFDGKDTNWATGKARDISSNRNYGSLAYMSTSSSPTPGKIGQAMYFNGTSNYIDLTGAAGTLQIQAPRTITGWLNTTNFTSGPSDVSCDPANRFHYIYSDGNGVGLNLYTLQNGSLNFDHWYDGSNYDYLQSTTHLSTSTWYHFAAVQDSSRLKLYINGAFDSATDQANTTNFFVAPPTVGYAPCGSTDFFYPGKIDDMRFYNRALSAAEVKQLYNLSQNTIGHSNTIISNGLVGYWTFDGPSIDWHTNTVKDMSGQGNTGTLVSMSTTSSPTPGKIGQAVSFNNNGYINLGQNAPLTDDTSANTVAAWFQTSASGTVVSVNDVDYPSTSFSYDPLIYVETNGKLHGGGYISGFPSLESANSVNDGKWHHAVVTYDGSNIQALYLDGWLVGRATGVRTGVNPSADFWRIGTGYTETWPGTNDQWFYLAGKIDDVRVYNRALSAQEVKQLYNAGR
jgi:hypothetical protein